jgi:hypothetical protein
MCAGLPSICRTNRKRYPPRIPFPSKYKQKNLRSILSGFFFRRFRGKYIPRSPVWCVGTPVGCGEVMFWWAAHTPHHFKIPTIPDRSPWTRLTLLLLLLEPDAGASNRPSDVNLC